MSRRQTRYVTSGDAQLAYQVAGEGPAVVCMFGTVSMLTWWEHPLGGPFFDRVAEFATCIAFDPRGAGRSDPMSADRSGQLEQQAADAIAVLDDLGIERAFFYTFHAGGGAAIVAAHEYPDRVAGLHLLNAWPRALTDGDYPGLTPASSEAMIEAHRERFGSGMFADLMVASRPGDPEIHQLFETIEQQGASRAQAMLLTRMAQEYDVRHLLPEITVPTVVMHSSDNRFMPLFYGRYIADHIRGARFVEVPGQDHAIQLTNPEPILAELALLVTGERPRVTSERFLTTVLFADIAGSTERLADIGDLRWRQLLDRHRQAVRQTVDQFGGREINTRGDDFLLTFDSPERAVRCARALCEESLSLGLEVRAGIHTGECERLGDDISGLAVHIGARIAALAGPSEVLVSRTVKDLVVGSGLAFVDRGAHTLKGVPDEWQVLALEP